MAERGAYRGALAVEYLQMLVDTRQFDAGHAGLRLRCRPRSATPTGSRFCAGRLPWSWATWRRWSRCLQREYAVVREGETMLSDLWFELQARRLAAQDRPAADR